LVLLQILLKVRRLVVVILANKTRIAIEVEAAVRAEAAIAAGIVNREVFLFGRFIFLIVV